LKQEEKNNKAKRRPRAVSTVLISSKGVATMSQ
jgi:hypothetical protein